MPTLNNEIKFNCLTGFLNYYNNNIRTLSNSEYDAIINDIVKNDFAAFDDVIVYRKNGILTAISIVKINYKEGS